MERVPDHPVIRHAELFGMDEGPAPVCPCCGAECETVYRSKYTLEILGCSECLDALDADSVSECFPEEEE